MDVLADFDFDDSDGIILSSMTDAEDFNSLSLVTKELKIPLYLEMAPGHDQISKLPPSVYGMIIGSVDVTFLNMLHEVAEHDSLALVRSHFNLGHNVGSGAD